MKQWNGLAESNIKKSKSMVTSMLSIAKHLSESFWTKAWELSDLIHSLGQCKIVGKGNITKFQSVRGYAPDLNSIILLPFGQPVEFHIPKAERGMFHEKSRAGSYIGASLDHPGAIQVWSHNTRRIITTASFKVKHVIPDPDITFERNMFRDVDDISDSVVSDLRDPTELSGPITRQRTSELERISMADSLSMSTDSISLPFQEEISNNEICNQSSASTPTADDVSQLSTNIPMSTMPSQEGADNIRSYAQVLLTQPVLQEGDSTRSQEGASTRSQEGGTSTGPTTRSQSRNSSTSLNSTPIPQVITSVSTLRQSSRLHGKPKVTYDTDVPPTRDTSSFRLLIKARRINGKAVTNVAIGLSDMPNAGYGLIALKNIKESTRICSYGKLYASNPIYHRV
jgi:hypothetical protein